LSFWSAGSSAACSVRQSGSFSTRSANSTLSRKSQTETSFSGSVKGAGITVGYIGDIAVRIFVYLIAVLAAVDILNMDYMSKLMTTIVEYIPHVVAFVIILIVGFLLADYFIDFLGKYYAKAEHPAHQPGPLPHEDLPVLRHCSPRALAADA